MLSEQDILNNAIFGPPYRQGLAQGKAMGRIDALVDLVLDLIGERFGKVTAKTRKRVAVMEPDQLRRAVRKVHQAGTIDDVFAQ